MRNLEANFYLYLIKIIFTYMYAHCKYVTSTVLVLNILHLCFVTFERKTVRHSEDKIFFYFVL